MPITRYQPSTDLLRPFFDDMMAPFGRMGSSMRVPDTDVIESENEIRVVCELPGMRPQEVELNVENNVLTIAGEKREERQTAQEGDNYHLSERRWGRFSRSFVLPREVNQDQIKAQFDNGVLSVTIPKNEKARRRKIEIGQSQGEGGKHIEQGSRASGGQHIEQGSRASGSQHIESGSRATSKR